MAKYRLTAVKEKRRMVPKRRSNPRTVGPGEGVGVYIIAMPGGGLLLSKRRKTENMPKKPYEVARASISMPAEDLETIDQLVEMFRLADMANVDRSSIITSFCKPHVEMARKLLAVYGECPTEMVDIVETVVAEGDTECDG